MQKEIRVFDICSIDHHPFSKDVWIEGFGTYLKKHYQNLQRPHRHSFYHMVLFTKGKGTHTIDFEKFTVRVGQIYFMITGQVHSWHFEKDIDGYVINFNEVLFTSFLQNGHYLDRFSFFNGDALSGVCQVFPSLMPKIIALFEDLVKEKNSNNAMSVDMVRLCLLEIFILIERFCPARKYINKPPQKLVLFRSFQKLIDQHFRTIKLPKEYAQFLYVTPNYLNALCQDLVGKTAGDVIRDRVLLEAKRLLTNAEMTVTEIAYDLDFKDNSYFNRFFKKSVGKTPDEFRKAFTYQ